jgi:hypothetical protein
MVAAVSFERLDLFRTDRDREGKRKLLTIKLADAISKGCFWHRDRLNAKNPACRSQRG